MSSDDVCSARASARACAMAACALAGPCACAGEQEHDRISEASEFALHPLSLGCFESAPSLGECQRDADCSGDERCVLDDSFELVDRAPLPLACAAPRGRARARERCERGEDCESGLCGLVGACLETCRDDDDCASDRSCRPIEVRVSEAALAPVMACTRALAFPGDVEVTLSSHPQRLRAGRNTLRVPGTLEPAVVYVQGECGRALDVLTLHAGDGPHELYDKEALRAGKGAENPVLHDGSALATFIIPNNPALAAFPAGLTLGVRVGADELAAVTVASRGPGRRMLDLNVFYVGGGEGEAPGGYRPGERRVARMLHRLDERFQAIGLALGQVREYDVVGALREELAVLEVPRRTVGEREVEGRPLRLDELFRLSAGAETPGINVFLVRDMSSYLGISGGIPGVLGVHGTARSGVALAADVLGDLSGAELVLMHELAHYMGLFHTTESSGLVLDPLGDTPACALTQDEDHDRVLTPDECLEYGGDNLMFWSGGGDVLSPQQIQVLASSAVLR